MPSKAPLKREESGRPRTQVRNKSDLRIDFRNVGEFCELLARVFVQGTRILFWRGIRRWRSPGAAKIALRCDEYGIKQAGAGEALRGQCLQTDAQRKHGHQGSDTDSNAQGRERVAKHSFAQIARRQFAQVSRFQGCTPSLTSRPSERSAMRFANFSARGRSCVTMMIVIPSAF